MSDKNFTKLRPPSYGTMNSKGEIVIPNERTGQQQFSTASRDLPFEERVAQHEGYISLPGFSDEDDDEEERDYNTLLNEYLITTPFILLALISFIILLHTFSEDGAVLYKWDIFLLGVTGWCAVFLIRKPVFLIFSKLVSLKVSISSILTLLFVGFIEEVVRMGWLYRFEDEDGPFLIAYWLGLGWASAEAVYFIIQNFIELRWYKDELVGGGRYAEEREELEEILGRPLTKVSAWWGVMWRFSWIMFHIGFSCWIASSYILVFPAAFIHGLLLVIWGYCLPVFGIPATSYGTLLLTMSVFLIGLALFKQIV
ncbi:hypothetical protein RclHR1_03960015 [Rhizophagus clarus]|uniref:Uncharacterized protein n=1 Tax=Rhizophagus clarus TaxID=94130 RepID=A0A2Z6RFP0_9GLOM|nr:hypothetical protein RclHR1_03960015 [Rhizophagus clarus]GES79640.1 hypothetical protein GLOIN_2v1595339 [Rhizophagus clarus]